MGKLSMVTQIRNYIRREGPATSHDIADHFGIPKRNASGQMSNMAHRGLLAEHSRHHDGAKSSGRPVITWKLP